jgi:hypothetical protein
MDYKPEIPRAPSMSYVKSAHEPVWKYSHQKLPITQPESALRSTINMEYIRAPLLIRGKTILQPRCFASQKKVRSILKRSYDKGTVSPAGTRHWQPIQKEVTVQLTQPMSDLERTKTKTGLSPKLQITFMGLKSSNAYQVPAVKAKRRLSNASNRTNEWARLRSRNDSKSLITPALVPARDEELESEANLASDVDEGVLAILVERTYAPGKRHRVSNTSTTDEIVEAYPDARLYVPGKRRRVSNASTVPVDESSPSTPLQDFSLAIEKDPPHLNNEVEIEQISPAVYILAQLRFEAFKARQDARETTSITAPTPSKAHLAATKWAAHIVSAQRELTTLIMGTASHEILLTNELYRRTLSFYRDVIFSWQRIAGYPTRLPAMEDMDEEDAAQIGYIYEVLRLAEEDDTRERVLDMRDERRWDCREFEGGTELLWWYLFEKWTTVLD